MAIHNASDLLVYARSNYDADGNPTPANQVTRIRIKTNNPFDIEDGQDTGTLVLNNVTDSSGAVIDGLTFSAPAANTGGSVLSQIGTVLFLRNYSLSSVVVDGDYTYQDFTNGAAGIVPTLSFADGDTTPKFFIKEDSIIVEVITPGSSAIFDPVAFSTSASFSVNRDLRDITNKDSGGWSESMPGLKSFEMSTDSLQSVNPDTPLDGSDFFDKLKNGTQVTLSFSDRIRNIIKTNLTQFGVDNFTSAGITQSQLQPNPFGGLTASRITSGSGTSSRLQYIANAGRLANKKICWSFYVKGSTGTGAKTECKFNIYRIISGTATVFPVNSITWSILEGPGTLSTTAPSNAQVNITGLSTSTWTRIQGSVSTEASDAGPVSYYGFYLYPSAGNTLTGDNIFTSSWQIETAVSATDYQDPINITHWQGEALVSSISFDSGVEDNLTCSATFTGTSNLYPNGLGPELIEDTGFDDPNYWTVHPTNNSLSTVEDGYGKIKSNSANAQSYITKTGLFTVGDTLLLEYTVAVSTAGGLFVMDGWDNDIDPDVAIPSSVGTHKVLLKPSFTGLLIKRASANNNVWLSSISLKKVL
tara:strand:- start:353 stop:2113 length:1761 start_codon:yes stop_codon:yes gene_type:complete